MKRVQFVLGLTGLQAMAALVAVNSALAQPAPAQPAPAQAAPAQPATEFQPTVGQQGKDVVWVPTSQALVDKMLDTAKVTPNDTVIDLGSGDGRTVITAAKRGARATGIEFNPSMVALAKQNAAKEGVGERANFINGDLFEADLSNATVLTMFLLTEINLRLRPKILDLKPGTRVVSNTFQMGDWTPDQTFNAGQDCKSFCNGYFWVVPAKVEGRWHAQNGDLTLEQKYQMVSGTMKMGEKSTPITGGKLNGDEIAFTAGDTNFRGRVSGNSIEGTSERGGATTQWRATRQ